MNRHYFESFYERPLCVNWSDEDNTYVYAGYNFDYDVYRSYNEKYHAFILGVNSVRSTYEEVINDYKRLTKELDVLLNGNDAAEQASLCDIIVQLRASKHATDQ